MQNVLANNLESIKNNSNGFYEYLEEWDVSYAQSIKEIDLFNASLTSKWNDRQKIYFAKTFYHARGHFHEFLWLLGNFADDKVTKEIVLKNIAEEFNSSSQSHEQMYIHFAESVGADLEEEIIDGVSYLPFLKEFNKGHLKWLKTHDETSRFAAFSAYEHLDNVDYMSLWKLAKSLGISNKGLMFFKVHMHANHFKITEDKLSELWAWDSEKVRNAYSFIAQHQINMWKELSNAVFYL